MGKSKEKNMGKKKDKEKKSVDKKKVFLTAVLVLVMVAAGAFFTWRFISNNGEDENREFAYTELISAIAEGNIERVEMRTRQHFY